MKKLALLSIVFLSVCFSTEIHATEITERKDEKELIVYAVPEVEVEILEDEARWECDDETIDMLAHLIFAEAGSDTCTDEMLYGVGNVVLNRVMSDKFPNTIKGVINQKGQYACSGYYMSLKPTDRCYYIAEDLLLGNTVFPHNVVWQAGFKQGKGTYKKLQNIYFCY